MPPKTFPATAAATCKYGIVTVFNTNGSFNREFRITSAEVAAVNASANGIPPGVTQAEWEENRAHMSGMDFEEGDIEVRNGHLRIKYGDVFEGGRFIESFARFAPGEWSGSGLNVSVPANVIAQLQQHGRRRLKKVDAGSIDTDDPP